MNFFDFAFDLIVQHEGGYVNDPDDPGGETCYGISKRSYPDLDISRLTAAQAKEIYKNDYWLKCGCDLLSFPIALCLFDSAVNQGRRRACKALQKILLVEVDGIIGPITIKAMNYRPKKEQDSILTEFCAARIIRYAGTRNFDKYGVGWVNRVLKTYHCALLSESI